MAPRLCVFCRRQPAEPPWEPFCSERCRLHDLAKWIDGTYRVSGEPVPPEDSENPGDDNDSNNDG